MSASHAPWRATLLTYSRVAGAILAFGIIVLAASLVFLGVRSVGLERQRGDAHARSVIAKVRACHRTPPHPTWDECERKVQDAE
jgi:hypothetical protein